MAGSPRVSPALAAQLRAFSVISSSLRAELSTSRNHSVGKVSAEPMILQIVRVRSLYVSGIAEDDSSLSRRPLPQWLSGRGSFLHASQAYRPEKRGSPLPIGRTGTDSIPLTLHCIRTRPAGKEVRLRLVPFDARFILSRSVVHYVPDTSSEGERKRETETAGVPLLCTPSLSDSQSGIATLALRSLSCRTWTLQWLQFLRCCYGISAESAEPVTSLVILSCSIPPPTLRHSSPFRRPGSHVRSMLPLYLHSAVGARAGKTPISRLGRHTVRLLPHLSACLLTLRKTERTMQAHRPFRLPTSRAVDMRTLQGQCIMKRHLTPEATN